MIADLLQLILIGSAAFKSATDGTDDRPPGGMVLNDTGKGLTGIGYAFLNIATGPNAYYVIGTYLEHGTKNAKCMLIQYGYDRDAPKPINQPLYHKKLIKNGNILPPNDLENYMIDQGYYCYFPAVKSYHKTLFDLDLLPFDFTKDEKKLNDYKLIIRSFSRGKGFKYNSESLKNFLFGEEREATIFDRYQSELDNIKSQFEDSKNFNEQIELLKRKKNAVKNLAQKEAHKNSKLKTWLCKKLGYWNQQKLEQRLVFNQASAVLKMALLNEFFLNQKYAEKKLTDHEIKLSALRKDAADLEKSEKQLQEMPDENRLNEIAESAKKYLSQAEQNKTLIEQVEKWLETTHTIKGLTAHYHAQKQNQSDQERLTELKEVLDKSTLKEKIFAGEWLTNFEAVKKQNTEDIALLEIQITKAEAMMRFTDADKKHSLAWWAINRQDPLSREEESTLLHLIDTHVTQPENIEKQYLPDPETFFGSLKTAYHTDEGFWLNLQGLYRYIPYIAIPVLNDSDPISRRKTFREQYEKRRTLYEQLVREKDSKTELLNFLHAIPGLEKLLDAWKRKEQINQFKVLEKLSITQEEFDRYLKFYEAKDFYLQEYDTAFKAWEEAYLKKRTDQYLRTNLKEIIIGLKTKLAGFNGDYFPMEENVRRSKLNVETCTKRTRRYIHLTRISPENEASFVNEWENRDVQIDFSIPEDVKRLTDQVKSIRTTRSRARRQILTAQKEIREALEQAVNNSIDIPTDEYVFIENDPGKEDQGEYDNAIIIYNNGCSLFATDFLHDELYRFETEKDWRKLAKAAAPDIFNQHTITEADFDTEIDNHLENIIASSVRISDTKASSILNILEEVDKSVKEYLGTVNELKRYFNGNDKKITGGYKVVLADQLSQDYPINWISEFKKRFRQELADRSGLFEIISKPQTLREIIMQAFQACEGRKRNPDIKDLLNPKMYFDLSFKIEKEGQVTPGSNGQTYSAIALLCIARLSLIEKDGKADRRAGLRFMPIDEAEGLGSNYDMLASIARNEDYQVVTMSIKPVGDFSEGEQYTYILNEPEDDSVIINAPAFAIFTSESVETDLDAYIEKLDG